MVRTFRLGIAPAAGGGNVGIELALHRRWL